MKRRNSIGSVFILTLFFLTGCGSQLEKTVQHISDKGVSYDWQLPSGWQADKQVNTEFGLQTMFSAEDTKSNSFVFVTTVPVGEVRQKNFGEQTRKKLKERYKYKQEKDIYMKKIKIGTAPAFKYTLNTTFREKSVWAHFYYIWTEHGFIQMTFYSADDNAYKKRSEKIDASAATFKETKFNEAEALKEQESEKREAGDVITFKNDTVKMETTAVRQITGMNSTKLLAIRYTFTNLAKEPVSPVVWSDYVTAKQNNQVLTEGKLPADTSLLDVKSLVTAQLKQIKQGESVESVVLYELVDKSSIELSVPQTDFPGMKPARVMVPE